MPADEKGHCANDLSPSWVHSVRQCTPAISAPCQQLFLKVTGLGLCCLNLPLSCADARKIANFVRANLWDEQRQRLLRSFLNGPSDVEGFADDYSFVISGLLDLYSASGETQWLAFAQQLQQKQDELFWDDKAGRPQAKAYTFSCNEKRQSDQ